MDINSAVAARLKQDDEAREIAWGEFLAHALHINDPAIQQMLPRFKTIFQIGWEAACVYMADNPLIVIHEKPNPENNSRDPQEVR